MRLQESKTGETSLHKEVSPVLYFFESALVLQRKISFLDVRVVEQLCCRA
jgi:hypothetical protein